MREKVAEKIIITLVLALFLSEMLKVCATVYGSLPIINGITMFFSIVFVVWLWTYLVIINDKKNYEKRKKADNSMIQTVEFDEIYNKLKQEHKDYLETKRKAPRDRLRFRYTVLAVIGACVTLGVFYILCGQLEMAIDLLQLIIIMVVAFGATFFSNEKDILEYKAAYKLRIINSLVKHINPNYEYMASFSEADRLLSEYEVANFGLIEYNIYECIDKIEGNAESGWFELSEMKLGYNAVMENGKIKYEDVFKGFFGRMELVTNNPFKLKLSAVGIKTRAGILESGTNKIKLDSNEFMDNFVVQTNDKILAMRILTSDILTELLDYKNKYGLTLDISIKNGNMYFLFYTGDVLEPDVMNNSMDKDVMLKDYVIIKMITDLIQKMGMIVKYMQSE